MSIKVQVGVEQDEFGMRQRCVKQGGGGCRTRLIWTKVGVGVKESESECTVEHDGQGRKK